MASSGNPLDPRPISIKIGPFGFFARPVPFRVFPPCGEGPLFYFENQTPVKVNISFTPENLVLEADGKTPVPALPVPPGNSRNLLVNTSLAPGSYQYKVSLTFVELRGAEIEAAGCSRPEIEIRR